MVLSVLLIDECSEFMNFVGIMRFGWLRGMWVN